VDGDPVDIAALLRFDLSSIPAGATVTAVDLIFRVTNTSVAYPIYELRKDFLASQATWNQARSGTSWEQPGAAGTTDRGTAVLGTFAPSTGTTPFTYTLSFTAAGVAAVQGWVSTPASNHGMIISNPTPSNGGNVSSSDDPTPANRPAMRVSYTSGGTPFTLTFQNGVSPSATYAGAQDTVIGNGPNPNLEGLDLYVDGFESDAATLIRFDVSGIPSWSTVVSVSLDGYVTNSSGQGYAVYELARDWSDTGATWLNADALTPWSLRGALGAGAPPGADHASTVLGLFRGPTNNAFNASTLNRYGAKLVQDWIRGTRTNHGFIIQDYADATDDGIGWDDSGSQRCDTAVPPNCINSSPGMTVVYNEGRFVFTSQPQRIRVGAPSAPFTLQRQRADDGALIAAGAPALGVTVRSSSAGGAFALSPAGPWSATLSVNIPAGAADSEPFHYRDAAAGSPLLTASVVPAWVDGTQRVSVSPQLLADDVESGQVPAASGGQWSQVSLQPSCTLSAAAAASHRGSYGLRVADADGQAGAGPQSSAEYLAAPVVPDLYFRTWFRYSGPNQLGSAQLMALGAGPLASLSLNLPARTVTGAGVNAGGAGSSENGALGVGEGTWHLLELVANGVGTTAGVRRTYVDGQINTTATALDWSGLGVDVISAGEPYSTDRRFTATLDFDDLRATTAPQPSRLQVVAPTTIPLAACTPVTVSLRESTLGGLADAPYDLSVGLQLRALPGALFSDSTCSTPITSTPFAQGTRTVTVYVSAFAVGGGVIAASHPDFLEGSDSFSIVTGQPLAISPPTATVNTHNVVGLTAAGGSGGGYRWSFLVNRSGGTLSPGGVYTAGATPIVTDVVQVTDSLGASATAPINVV
ncbi:MAG TPA: DNRLRE domain-containing protein, partial [Myxococcales bacterium]|nr:DNRLRE domain-containing protein [Myxococcales bacterium]